MNFIKKFKDWKHDRFLKKHGCETQQQYDRNFDVDIIRYAHRINDFYRGYPYVHVILRDPWNRYGEFLEGLPELTSWCDKNCQGKYRYDIHRVSKQMGIGSDGSSTPEWFFDEMGGGDLLFFAFKDQRDLTMFILRWS